jgi:hypothetical protein
MIFASDTRLMAVAGIVYALAASALLCQAAFAAFPLQAGAKTVGRGADISRMEHGMDARLGACLLVIGFALQMIGTLGTTTLNGPAALLLLALALGLAVYTMMKSTLAENFLGAEVAVQAPVAAPVVVAAAEPAIAEPANNLVELRPIKAVESAG